MLYFSRWKMALVLLAVVWGLLFSLPNLFQKSQLESWPSFLPKRQVVLGLDLQGGAHLVVEVAEGKLVAERIKNLRDEARSALRDARVGYRGLRASGRTVSLALRDPGQRAAAIEALQPLTRSVSGLGFGQAGIEEAVLGGEGAQITIALTEEGIEQRLRAAVTQSIEVIRRRIDPNGTLEPIIQQQGGDRILIQIPGVTGPEVEAIKARITQGGRMTFHLECPDAPVGGGQTPRAPPGCEFVPSDNEFEPQMLIEERSRLSGEDLSDAQPGFEQQTNEPIVSFRFNTKGARIFGQLSAQNVNKRFAVVLDGRVVTAPVIREAILGGSGQISGNFTVEETDNLAIILRAGALPVDLTYLEERTVGPSLGQDSIEAGRLAAVIALIAVALFMVLAYGLFGLFANLALFVNIILVFGALSAFGATLTLPGIAGIVLTVGMAVDANVLIFERIREEAQQGRTALNAIEAGYSRALATILDANITTFIAAITLFLLGSGPIQGFAVTLAIGIITTIFSAFTFSRLLISLWIGRTRPRTVPL